MRSLAAAALTLCLFGCKTAAPVEGGSLSTTSASEGRPFLVFVANEGSADVSIIDGARDEELARVSLGKRPQGLELSRDGKFLFVAVSGTASAPQDRQGDGIALVDLERRALVGTIESGSAPRAFDLSHDSKLLFVSNGESDTVSVVDLESRQVLRQVSVGQAPRGLRTTPDGKFIYVACSGADDVAVVSVESMTVVTRISTGAHPTGVVFSADGATAFVSAENAGEVTVIDARAHSVIAPISVSRESARPMGLLLTPDQEALVVSDGRRRTVSFVDLATRTVARIASDIGQEPSALGISPDGKKVYAANGPGNELLVIDTQSGAVLKKIRTGEGPRGITVN